MLVLIFQAFRIFKNYRTFILKRPLIIKIDFFALRGIMKKKKRN